MSSSQKESVNIKNVFLFLCVCLVFLTLGNLVFHSGILLFPENTRRLVVRHFAFNIGKYSSFTDFLSAIIGAARIDILFVLFIAFSDLIKVQKFFLSALFAYRSFIFGLCGAYIISGPGAELGFENGFFHWCLFFLYHICFFAIMICYGSAVLVNGKKSISKILLLGATACGEIALVILLNVVYYFLISIV